MPYMTSIQSVTGGISLSVSQNWSIAVWYFDDNELTFICLLTQQQSVTVSVRNKQVI